MGSGVYLRRAQKKDGIQNFRKDIIKFFDTSEEAFKYEAEIVNESLVKDPNCYNVKAGGDGWQNEFVKKNKVVVFDPTLGKNIQIDKDDERYLSGELKSTAIGKVGVRDKDGNTFQVAINDPKYISGEYVAVTKGRHLSEEHKKKISEFMRSKAANSKLREPRNRCWIYKFNEDTQLFDSLSVKFEELDEYYENGWQKGRRMNGTNIGIHHNKGISKNKGADNPNYSKHFKQVYRILENGDIQNKQINPDEVNEYLNNGWQLGHKYKNPGNHSSKATTGYIWMVNSDNDRIYIKAEYQQEYEAKGYIHKFKYK